MEGNKDDPSAHKEGGKGPSPSERTTRFILGLLDGVKNIFHGPVTQIPLGEVILHQGRVPAAGIKLRYPRILLVEDNPVRAREFVQAIRTFYAYGSVRILVAHSYDAAVHFFENEDIRLVIMDADLDDEAGDGTDLIQAFLGCRPEITVLANSSSRVSNLKLTGLGALDTLGKSTAKLICWLQQNDPAGANR